MALWAEDVRENSPTFFSLVSVDHFGFIASPACPTHSAKVPKNSPVAKDALRLS